MTTNLPQLTPDEKTAVGILLVSREPLAEIATQCGMSVLEFVELCADPRVQAHIDAARTLARKRADHIAQDARAAAIHTLQDIAENPPAPYEDRHALIRAIERRRAATTILRAASSPHRRVHRVQRTRPSPPNPSPTTPQTADDTPIVDDTPPMLEVTAHEPRPQEPVASLPQPRIEGDFITTAGLASRPPNTWP